MSEEPPSGPLTINRIKLNNFRSFVELEVDLDPRLTVLVANNGQGKTAVLEALAIALGPYVGAFDEGKDRGFQVSDIRLVRAENSNTMEMAAGGVSLEAEGYIRPPNNSLKNIPNGKTKWSRQRKGSKAKTTYKEAKPISELGKAFQDKVRREAEKNQPGGTGTCLPIIAYYDTGRLWHIRKKAQEKLNRTSRMVGYTRCLEAGSDYQLLSEWLRYWAINAWKNRIEAQQANEPINPSPFDDALEAVSNAVNDCLKPVSGWGDLDYNMAREELTLKHEDQGELPISMLSDGIRSMFALVADIAFRMVKLNPNLGPYAAQETPGIVLIDEVDMHLHPEWQQWVLQSLQKAFPKVQFVVATHSPQVLSTIPNKSIRVIRMDWNQEERHWDSQAQTPGFQSKGVASTDVLSAVMGIDPVPEVEEAKKLARYRELIEKGEKDSAEATTLRENLLSHFGPEHPVMLDCDRLVRLQEFKAQKNLDQANS
jgi:predicted ATP-binding protein involved in virulence